jgi:hypothetical protein
MDASTTAPARPSALLRHRIQPAGFQFGCLRIKGWLG